MDYLLHNYSVTIYLINCLTIRSNNIIDQPVKLTKN